MEPDPTEMQPEPALPPTQVVSPAPEQPETPQSGDILWSVDVFNVIKSLGELYTHECTNRTPTTDTSYYSYDGTCTIEHIESTGIAGAAVDYAYTRSGGAGGNPAPHPNGSLVISAELEGSSDSTPAWMGESPLIKVQAGETLIHSYSTSGEQEWTLRCADVPPTNVASSPQAVPVRVHNAGEGAFVFGSFDDFLVCNSEEIGSCTGSGCRRGWYVENGTVVHSFSAVANTTHAVRPGGGILEVPRYRTDSVRALDQDGSQVWRAAMNHPIAGNFHVDRTHVVLGTNDPASTGEGSIVVLDAESGEEIQMIEGVDPEDVALGGGIVWMRHDEQQLTAFLLETGEEITSFTADGDYVYLYEADFQGRPIVVVDDVMQKRSFTRP